MGVLPVEVDDPDGRLGEGGDGRGPPVDVGPGPPVDRDHAGEHELVVADDEATVDAGLGRAGPDDRGVGPAADEQLQGLDEHRLAGAGLPRDGGQPRPEAQVEPLDHAEVLDVQLGQHEPRSTGPRAGTSP